MTDIIRKAGTYEDINMLYQYIRYSERLLLALEYVKNAIKDGEKQLAKLNDIECRDGCISIKMHSRYHWLSLTSTFNFIFLFSLKCQILSTLSNPHSVHQPFRLFLNSYWRQKRDHHHSLRNQRMDFYNCLLSQLQRKKTLIIWLIRTYSNSPHTNVLTFIFPQTACNFIFPQTCLHDLW